MCVTRLPTTIGVITVYLHLSACPTCAAGDSRAILVKTDGSIEAMSDDHKPNRPDEIQRIKVSLMWYAVCVKASACCCRPPPPLIISQD